MPFAAKIPTVVSRGWADAHFFDLGGLPRSLFNLGR
jgi:hypothetical protein